MTTTRTSFGQFSPSRRQFLAGSGVAGLALAAGRPLRAQEPVEITMWSWVPNLQLQIDYFMEMNPDIKVNLVNAGQGGAQYMELRNAIQAGRGAPDVVQIALDMQPSFRLIGALKDIGPLGANEVAGDFVDWTWAQVSSDGAVTGIPWDSGPMAVIYRGDLFDAAGIGEAATWAEFRDMAAAYRAARPDSYITSAAFSAGAWANALFWQAGARPFEIIDAETIRIRLNSPEAKSVADYWSGLLADDLVDPQPIFNNDWYTALDRGAVASWITAGWGPAFMSSFAQESMGKWRASALPNWDAAAPASSNWGGSSIAVMESTTQPEAAARLAIFLGHDSTAAQMFIDNQFLFPVLKEKLESESFLNAQLPFYNNVPYNQVLAESSRLIDNTFQFSPFQDYVDTVAGQELSGAAIARGSIAEALDRVQEIVATYAADQGFTVET